MTFSLGDAITAKHAACFETKQVTARISPQPPPARGQHGLPVRAQEGRLAQCIARVSPPGAAEIDVGLDEHFVSVVGQG